MDSHNRMREGLQQGASAANLSFGRLLSNNPFDPASGPARISPNRRRWTHIFPKAPSGDYFQPFQFGGSGDGGGGGGGGRGPNHQPAPPPRHRPLAGVTVHEWTAESAVAGDATSAGVDWKSLTAPALLPVTTDYFPGVRYVKQFIRETCAVRYKVFFSVALTSVLNAPFELC